MAYRESEGGREGEGRVYREEKLPRVRNEGNGTDTGSIYRS